MKKSEIARNLEIDVNKIEFFKEEPVISQPVELANVHPTLGNDNISWGTGEYWGYCDPNVKVLKKAKYRGGVDQCFFHKKIYLREGFEEEGVKSLMEFRRKIREVKELNGKIRNGFPILSK